MEESRRHRDRAAGLRHQARGKDGSPHGLADLGFGDGHDVVDISLHVGKIQHAYALRSQTIGRGLAVWSPVKETI